MRERIEKLRERMRELDVPAALIRHPVNVGYLSGFSGSTAALLITESAQRFITDSRYRVQAGEECPGFAVDVTETGGTYEARIAASAREIGVQRLAVESDFMTLRQSSKLGEELKEAKLEPVDDLVAPLRAVKDEEELRRIRHACAIADAAFEQILPLVRPGVIERDLAIELEHFMKKQSAEKEAFDTIVASGPRSALPHGRASARRLEAGDFVTFDFGARWEGYNSDLTRTVVLGRASDEQRNVYMTVLGAQMAALAAIRPEAEAKQVDAVARDRIAAAGYGERFGHGLGHALGREVHDGGGMNSRSEMKLAAGMVMTVEPGIYIDGWGGVRIEDDVVVTGEGCEILTHAPKELIELDG